MSSWTDLIADFMSLTEGVPSPEIFRRWSGIAMIGGALERRVWAKAGDRVTYPNLYTLLVAGPGGGKQVIEEVHELWSTAKEPGSKATAFHVAPDNMTKAALVDTLAKAKKTRLLPEPQAAVTFHSLLVAAEEFQVLLPNYDTEYIGTLNLIFNNPSRPYAENRRFGPVRELKIELPQLNILAGAQPSYFVSTFPEEAWTTGFARRIIMIYSGSTPFKELFEFAPEREPSRKRLEAKLSHLAGLWGQIKWTPEAAEKISLLHRAGIPPTPTHSKLTHYIRSRTMHLIKLTMIAAVARTGGLVIEELDVERARCWLLEAEHLMPDIFREMIGKSDIQVIEEMHFAMLTHWTRNKQQPIAKSFLMRFLIERVPSEKAGYIIQMAEQADVIRRMAGSQELFTPGPKVPGLGVE